MLFGIDAYLRQQQVQTNLQATAFFNQLPVHLSNASAEHIDRAGAQLGLTPNASYSQPISINNSAAREFLAIDHHLNEFLYSQASKISGPLDPLPPELDSYINAYRPIIDEIQLYLISNEAPQWEMNSDRMADPKYPPPGFFNIRSLQKLLLVSAIQAHQQGQTDKVIEALEASWQLNQTIAERADLSSQFLVAIISVQRASILRHLSQMPTDWQTRLQAQGQVQPVVKGMIFETWLQYRIRQNDWIPTVVVTPEASLGEKLRATLANRFSAQSYFKLRALNNTQTDHRALEQLTGLNVCTTPQAVVERQLSEVKTANWNKNGEVSASVIAKRWQTAEMRSLSLELSLHVLQLKSHFEATGSWPTSLAPIPSAACPNETWIYTPHQDGSISLTFSRQLLSPSAIPLSYHSPVPITAEPST